MAKRITKQLHTPEVRERAKAKLKEGAKKRRIAKLVESIETLDLAPIDNELAELRQRIAKLEATRNVIMQIRNAGDQADADPQREATASLKGDALADAILAHLKLVQPASLNQLCEYFAASRLEMTKLLTGDNRFEHSSAGWSVA